MIYGIILASGMGTRFNDELPKQFVKIAGKTVLEHTIDIFETSQEIDKIILVITPQYRHILEEILLKNNFKKIYKVLNGGLTRKESSFIAISSITNGDDFVIIHDCARPFLSAKIIKQCVQALMKYDAVDVAIDSADTLIKINDFNEITDIPNRSNMRRGQTPQCFKLSIIKKAHELSKNEEIFTDDCALVLKHDLCPIYVVEGESKNIKITLPEDIFLADKIFQINTINCFETYNLNLLNDKVIIVFGGHSGIGLSLINLAKKFGAKAYAFSRKNDVDISKYSQVEKKLEEIYRIHSKIDYVIISAGILNIGKLLDKNINTIEKEISINLMGSINVCKASIPYLCKTSGGIMLFTSSSYTRGRALYSIYSSTKAAIVNLTQALAEELYCDNIRINAINPERTNTPMRFKNFGKEPEESLLSSDKVAIVCLNALLSDYTGQIIDVRK